MRDPLLEYGILQALALRPEPIREFTLGSEVTLRVERKDVTREDFVISLSRLEQLGLIQKSFDLLCYKRWSITDQGKKALSEVGL